MIPSFFLSRTRTGIVYFRITNSYMISKTAAPVKIIRASDDETFLLTDAPFPAGSSVPEPEKTYYSYHRRAAKSLEPRLTTLYRLRRMVKL